MSEGDDDLDHWEKIKAKRRARQKERYVNDPEFRAKRLAKSQAAGATPERKAYLRAYFARPEIKAKVQARRTPEYRAKVLAERQDRYANDPEYRAKVLSGQKVKRAAPDYKEKRRAYLDKPETKALIYVQDTRRLQTNIQRRISHYLRSSLGVRLRRHVRQGYKAGSAVRDLGCTIDEFRAYIEAQFLPGMTWDNWSLAGWHLDHKRPLSSFDLTDREEFLRACHYTNYQPLWAEDNLRKSNKQ